MSIDLPAPWGDFLAAIDQALPAPVALHCLGGFVVAVRYGFPRSTLDLDYVEGRRATTVPTWKPWRAADPRWPSSTTCIFTT